MDNSWKEIFKDYPKRNELGITVDNINKKRQTATIYPPIKVVLLGQDPYHNPGQACGLSFSVNDGVPLPKSLINIYKELYDDLGITPAKTGNLEKWFKQGIFLLNSVLTVEEYSPASHGNVGWQDFTDYIIETISQKNNNVVFVLWGSYARSKKTLIDSSRHKIIESPHPSPLSAYRGFFGSKVFSRINSYLEEVGKKPIDFNLEN